MTALGETQPAGVPSRNGSGAPAYWIGVDTGGTFTDSVALDSNGNVYLAKTPSTPQNLATGVMESVRLLAESAGLTIQDLLGQTQKVAHGTTATVNAMVQRRGARIGFITTRGFRDHLILMKSGRGTGVPDTERVRFSRASKPAPLAPLQLTEEVTERIDYAGRVLIPLDEQEAKAAVHRLVSAGVEAIAVSLLWSFRNPEHEERIRTLVNRIAPGLPVSLGSELVPVMGEYERSTTATTNAYLGPTLSRYVNSLQDVLSDNGFRYPVLLMQSDGGLIPGAAAPERAVTTMLSGLAAGVLGAKAISSELDVPNVITIDMGGTSFEVGMVYNGQPVMEHFPLTPRLEPYMARWRIAAPTIDITAIGAGGGSIARAEDGLIKVGPISAGAEPGPACYGRGGTEPTVTDAFLVLGFLNPDNFLGGRMVVDKRRAEEAIVRRVAEPLGLDVVSAALGIYRVVISHMADLIRKVTIERGHDPRDFVMVAFGGSGPVHSAVLGAEVGVAKVLVPGNGLATALSAYGLVSSSLKSSKALTRPLGEPFDPTEVAANLDEVARMAHADIISWGAASDEVLCVSSIDMRYAGQIHSINVPVPSSIATVRDLDLVFERFESKYESTYGQGTSHRSAGIEMVTFRAEASNALARIQVPAPKARSVPAEMRLKGARPVHFESGTIADVPVYDGASLAPHRRIEGPAVVEYMGNTVVVHPGQAADVDAHLNLIFDFGGQRG